MIAILDYGMGNLRSVAKAFEAAGASPVVTSSPDVLQRARGLVLPGVGAFGDGMASLRQRGLVEVLEREVRDLGKPLLGICLGMQLLGRASEESPGKTGLGWLPADVVRIRPDRHDLKVPHVGWNDVRPRPGAVLYDALPGEPTFYFVHAFHMVCDDPSVVSGTFEYGGTFTASIETDHLFATQFHPEKSQKAGISLIGRFLVACGS